MTQAILVAGGAGYIGSHVCKVLAASGYLPVTLDNLTTGFREFVRWGPLIEAHVAEREAVQHAVREHSIRAVIDLAGSIEVGESVRDPLKFYDNNAGCKIAFLRHLQDVGIKAFVFSSTAAVYGEPEYVPIPEKHPLQPKNPYGWSKRMVEQMLADTYAAGGPAWMALRYFNAAGASADGDIGESHQPETHLIPLACLAALGKRSELEIFGDDYPTPDGTAIRDYVHVMDLAHAHVLAVESLLGGMAPAAYNLGSGNGTSAREILECCEKNNIHVPHMFKGRRAGDPARLVANATAAQRELNWRPEHGIDGIITSAFAWHQKSKAR